MISDPLRQKATDFATEIQSLLNGTICSHANIRAAAWQPANGGLVFIIGSGVSAKNPFPGRFPARQGSKRAQLWMEVSFQLQLDYQQEHLSVQKSFFGVFLEEESKEGLCHYDYERDKADGYPDAHIQVYGSSAALDAMNRGSDKGRSLSKLHFPVGGKRFRPCLEDLIDFLVVERLVDAREGYEKIIDAGREKFHRNQLRAAIRRRPEVAREYLHQYDALAD